MYHSKKTIVLNILLQILLLPAASFAVRGDYSGDGKSDLVVATVDASIPMTFFTIKNIADDSERAVQLFGAADVFVPGDFDGDGITDLGFVFDGGYGYLSWRYLLHGEVVPHSALFGLSGSKPLVGDFDCDGKADRAAVSTNDAGKLVWDFDLSSGVAASSIEFGKSGNIVYAAHVSSAICDDLVVVSAGKKFFAWSTRSLSGATTRQVNFGSIKDTLYAPADTDADGKDEFIVLHPGKKQRQALIRRSDGTQATLNIGAFTDVPISGNFAGVGTFNFGVYRKGKSGKPSSYMISLADGVKQGALGDSNSMLIRPDGTTVKPSEMSIGKCGVVVSISSLSGVLYKESNLHGGRGPTFLVQNSSEQTGKAKLLIKDMNCKVISSFGLYAKDYPYGERFYEGVPGGAGHNADELYALARKAKSSAILVEGVNGKWIKVNDPRHRQGSVSG